MDSKFKADPYNFSNNLIQESDILSLMKSLDIHQSHNEYIIHDISLYQKAFVHTSYTPLNDYKEYVCPKDCLPLQNKSYETMEFLGDSFLGTIIANYLYKRYVNLHLQDEGFLTKLKIRFVCGEQLAFLSEKLGFNKFIILSKHVDENCDGRNNYHILEDVFEAFLGAIYLDTNNYYLVERFVIQCIESFVDFSDLILKDNNYKDQLLRYFQHNFKIHPTYRTDKKNDMNVFICKIYKDAEFVSQGEGISKKKAEQNASKQVLIEYHVISD